MVISHDRYLIERIVDSTWALFGGGQLTNLPGGIEEYLRRRAAMAASEGGGVLNLGSVDGPADAPAPGPGKKLSSQQERELKKQLNAIERKMGKLDPKIDKVHTRMAEAAEQVDTAKLAELDADLKQVQAEREELEMEWLELAEQLEE